MSRVKRGVLTRAKHKKILKLTKGFRAGRSRIFKLAKQAVLKSGLNSYRDRRLKKRDFRRLWTIRVSAALKQLGKNYSGFMNELFKKDVVINRKMLAEIAMNHPEAFEDLVNKVK